MLDEQVQRTKYVKISMYVWRNKTGNILEYESVNKYG